MLDKQDLLNKGFQYFSERDYDKAEFFFRKALEMDECFEAAYSALSETLNRMERLDEAIRFVQKWIEYNCDNPNAHYTLSRLYVQKGMFTEAEQEMALSKRLSERTKMMNDPNK